MEQRGICTEYKTLEQVRQEIEKLNENQKKTSRSTATSDKGDIQEGSSRGWQVHTDDRQAAEIAHDAWKVAAIGSEAESEEADRTDTEQGDSKKA
jgi:hypothetical protein